MRTESLNQSEIIAYNRAVLSVVVLLGVAFFCLSTAAGQNNNSLFSAGQIENGELPPAAPINPVATANDHLVAASALPTPAPRGRQQRAPVDFNGDNKTDFTIVRTTTVNSPSFWYINNGNSLDARNG